MIKKFGLIMFLGLGSSFTQAQFKNIKVGDVTASVVADPTVAVSYKDQKNIVVVTSPNAIYSTADKGNTWEKVALGSETVGMPVVISDTKGTFYAFHVFDPEGKGVDKSMESILCHISRDGGKSWEAGSPLTGILTKDQYRPAASLDNKGNIVVTWTEFDKFGSADSTCQSRILLSSTSSGKKWSKPVELSQLPGNCLDDCRTVAGATTAVAPDGKFFVAWSNANKIYMDRSFNGDMWLYNDIPIADHKGGGWRAAVPGHDGSNGLPNLAIDQTKGTYRGCIYLTWSDKRSGATDSDVWFIRSNNHGDNWSSPMKLGDDKNAKHQYMPSMAVDQVTGYIYIAYYDRGEYADDQTEVYLSYSSDSGANFKTVKVSESAFTPVTGKYSGNHISIAAHGGVVVPVWSRYDEGNTSIWSAVINQGDLIAAPDASKGKKKK